MKRISPTICFFLIAILSFGQEKVFKKGEGIIVALNFTTTPIIGLYHPGLSFDFIYYPIKRYGTGLNASMFFEHSTNENYGYTILQPEISCTEYSWINQFNLIQNSKMLLVAGLNSGLSSNRLGDNSVIEYPAHGISGPKTIASNNYFMMEPGISFWYRIVARRGNIGWILAKANYRFIVDGKTSFASPEQFSGFIFSLGMGVGTLYSLKE